MKLSIAERSRPFSHRPGTVLLLPGSSYRVKIFPTRVEFSDVSSPQNSLAVLSLEAGGAVEEFTTVLDLERGCIRVWGRTEKGYFRYRLITLGDGDGLGVVWEKAPEQGVNVALEGAFSWGKASQLGLDLHGVGGKVHSKELLVLYLEPKVPYPAFYVPPSSSRLSLGNHRSQDWALVRRRMRLEEILPHWYRLGKMVEAPSSQSEKSLIGELKSSVQQNQKLQVSQHLKALFLAGTEGILSPCSTDLLYQGFTLPPTSKGEERALLAEGADLIEEIFLQSTDHSLTLLGTLPPELHCGRFLEVPCSKWGEVDLEWSKKMVRRVVIRAAATTEIALQLPKGLKSYRLRLNGTDRGRAMPRGEPLLVEAGQHYFLDNFEK